MAVNAARAWCSKAGRKQNAQKNNAKRPGKAERESRSFLPFKPPAGGGRVKKSSCLETAFFIARGSVSS